MYNITELLMSYSTTERAPLEYYPRRVSQLLKECGYNVNKMKYIHITGSKGKGSLARTSFEILKAQGFKTGLFMSPHIFDIRERFITEKGMIAESDLRQLIRRFSQIFQEQELHFFEICLFLALVYFYEQRCEYVVLEVGVGGRYDPTNFCHPELVLLGHISLEHRDFLGNTIEEIAYDKAGIIKKGVPALSITQEKVVREIFSQEGDVKFCEDMFTISNVMYDGQGITSFDLVINIDHTITLKNIKLHRIGKANLMNFCVALTGMLMIFPNMKHSVIAQVAHTTLPYRMDKVKDHVIIDTAHNGASFENLMNTLEEIKWKDIILYVTILEGKELQDIISVLEQHSKLFQKIVFFDFPTHNMKRSDAHTLFQSYAGSSPKEYQERLVIDQDPKVKKVFAGSFYSIPTVVSLLKNQK